MPKLRSLDLISTAVQLVEAMIAGLSIGRALAAPLRMGVLCVVVVALFLGTVRAQTASFFCQAMQEVRTEPCCRRVASEQAGIESTDCGCCRLRVSPALRASPPDVAGPTPQVVAATLVALLTLDERPGACGPVQSGTLLMAGIPPPPWLGKARTVLQI
jgi:hypothetical protein